MFSYKKSLIQIPKPPLLRSRRLKFPAVRNVVSPGRREVESYAQFLLPTLLFLSIRVRLAAGVLLTNEVLPADTILRALGVLLDDRVRMIDSVRSVRGVLLADRVLFNSVGTDDDAILRVRERIGISSVRRSRPTRVSSTQATSRPTLKGPLTRYL
jgi:hypothetical protein